MSNQKVTRNKYNYFSLSQEVNYDPLSEEEVDRNMDPNPSGPTSSSTSISLMSVNTTVTAHQTSLGATTVTSTSTGDIAPLGQTAPRGKATEERTVPGQSQQELKELRLKAQLTRDKIKTEAIREYQRSPEYKMVVKLKVKSRVEEVLSLIKVNELRQRNELHTKLITESAVLTPILQSPGSWERYLDIYKGISPSLDYLTYEKFFEVRHVPLWDCRGSVADICREAREAMDLGDGIILPAVRQGIR